MRVLAEAPAEAILAAQQRASLSLGLGHGTLPWQPAVDGRVVPRQPLEAIAAGEARGIPILAGTNRDEWKLFTLFDGKTRRIDGAALRRRLGRILPEKDEDGREWGERALEVYRAERTGGARARPSKLWEAIQADRIFRYPRRVSPSSTPPTSRAPTSTSSSGRRASRDSASAPATRSRSPSCSGRSGIPLLRAAARRLGRARWRSRAACARRGSPSRGAASPRRRASRPGGPTTPASARR